MTKKMALMICLLLLSGCWDKSELNEIAIALAIGIDLIDDEYVVTAQVIVPSELSQNGGTGNSQITMLKAKDKSVLGAINKVTEASPRAIYPGHLQILVFGETLAREKGIVETVDSFTRNWEVRSDFFIAVAKDTNAEEILKVQTPLEIAPIHMFYSIQQTAQNSGKSVRISLIEIAQELEKVGKQPVLAKVELKGDTKKGASKQNLEGINPEAQLNMSGLSVFKQDKLVGWLEQEDTVNFNIITNHLKSTVDTVSCPKEGNIELRINKAKSKLKGNVINGQPKIDMNIKLSGNINAIACDIDLQDENIIKELETNYEKQLKASMLKTIKKLQDEHHSDIFGFGRTIYENDPKGWNKIKEQWTEELFAELEVNIEVEATIKNTGITNNSLLGNVKD
ncbi:Ger(x)C family spore germination protein [Psychrobacillus sp. FSL K6-1267]|uniref:Ger(x)C family spore germination protein n=1 Tax=Psychrobacillus sp. FSL K6-1267 TaxID=2921543 RepID=UPI0030FBBD2F